MGRRVEIFLLFLIVIILFIPFLINIKGEKITKSANIKSEIRNFTEFEINNTNIEHILRAKRAVNIGDSWILNDINITNDSVKSLVSKNGVYLNNTIFLNKNITLIKNDGSIYKTDMAKYFLKDKNLDIDSNFTATKGKNILKGKKLFYNINKKVIKGKDVKGSFVLKKAKE